MELVKQRGRKSAASGGIFPRPHLIAPLPPSNFPAAPSHLGQEETRIWDDVVREYRGTDASLALLTSGLECHLRARECRETIAREGMVVFGRDDQAKAHPLLAVEHKVWLFVRGYGSKPWAARVFDRDDEPEPKRQKPHPEPRPTI